MEWTNVDEVEDIMSEKRNGVDDEKNCDYRIFLIFFLIVGGGGHPDVTSYNMGVLEM